MRIFRRHLIYVQVPPDYFIDRTVGTGRAIRRKCGALGNRAGLPVNCPSFIMQVKFPGNRSTKSRHFPVVFRAHIRTAAVGGVRMRCGL